MRKKSTLLITLLFILLIIKPTTSIAYKITIEPDDFSPGTNLSTISDHVTLKSTGGENVYSAPLDKEYSGITNSGVFQSQIFSRLPTENTEWFSWPDMSGVDTTIYSESEWSKEPHALSISFHSPVNYVSIYGLEIDLFGHSDPILWHVYDSIGNLVFSDYKDDIIAGSLEPSLGDGLSYWHMEFSYDDIGTVIIGGESEFTTLDKLSFNLKPVPEPSTLILLTVGLSGLFTILRLKQRKKYSPAERQDVLAE